MQHLSFDRKIAMIGFFSGMMLLGISIFLQKGIGLSLVLLFSCMIYIGVTRRKNDNVETTFPQYATSRTKLYLIHALNTICLIVFLAVSICFLHYSRPLEYFVLASALSSIICIEILILPVDDVKPYLYSILVQILLLSASLRLSVFSEYPDLIFSDWFHSFLTNYIITSGHVISPTYIVPWVSIQGSQYGTFPFMHLIVATTSLLTSISSYKISLFLSIGIFEIISPLFVFLAAMMITKNTKLALFSMLFLEISNWYIVYGFWLIPQSLGYCLFALMVYLLFRQGIKASWSNQFLIILIFSVTIFSHTLTSFVMVFTIAVCYIAEKVFFFLSKETSIGKEKIGITLPFVLFSATSVLMYWIFFSNFFTQSVQSLVAYSRAIGEISSPVAKSYIHYEFDQLGIYVLYILAIVGLLVWLRRRERNPLKASIVAGASALALVMYGSWAIGLPAILPERWFVFIFILIALPAAEGLKILVGAIKKRYALILTVLIVFSLTFLMITTGDANRDSPLFGKQEVERVSYPESEIRAAYRIANFSNSMIYTDQNFGDLIAWGIEREMISINFLNFTPPTEGIVIIRQYIYEHPVPLGPFGPYTFVNRTFEGSLQNMNKVYSNGQVSAYTPIGQ